MKLIGEAAEGGIAPMEDVAVSKSNEKKSKRMDVDSGPSRIQPRRSITKKRHNTKRGLSAVRKDSKISRMGRKPGRGHGAGRKTK